MLPHIAWWSACTVAILCAILAPSHSQDCTSEKIENATVDLKVALSKGVRGAEPAHVPSWEACVNSCCFGGSISGNKKCNLVVFRPQRRNNSPNCYLFHCPTEEACPVRQAIGLVTYRAIKEVPKPTSSLNKTLDLTVKGSFVSPKAVELDTPRPTTPGPTTPNRLGPSRKELIPTTMKILLGQVEEPVDKIHRHSHHQEDTGSNSSASSAPLPTHQSIHSRIPVNTPQNSVPNMLSTVKLPAVTPSTETRSVSTVPPRNASSTGHAATDYGNTYVATVSPRQSTPPAQLTATSQAKANNLSLLPSSLFSASSAALPVVHLGDKQPSRDQDTLNGAPGATYTLYLADKSVLLAALLFGVIFLLLAQVALGRKLLESLRHRRYSRLDYLINDMYANV